MKVRIDNKHSGFSFLYAYTIYWGSGVGLRTVISPTYRQKKTGLKSCDI